MVNRNSQSAQREGQSSEPSTTPGGFRATVLRFLRPQPRGWFFLLWPLRSGGGGPTGTGGHGSSRGACTLVGGHI